MLGLIRFALGAIFISGAVAAAATTASDVSSSTTDQTSTPSEPATAETAVTAGTLPGSVVTAGVSPVNSLTSGPSDPSGNSPTAQTSPGSSSPSGNPSAAPPSTGNPSTASSPGTPNPSGNPSTAPSSGSSSPSGNPPTPSPPNTSGSSSTESSPGSSSPSSDSTTSPSSTSTHTTPSTTPRRYSTSSTRIPPQSFGPISPHLAIAVIAGGAAGVGNRPHRPYLADKEDDDQEYIGDYEYLDDAADALSEVAQLMFPATAALAYEVDEDQQEPIVFQRPIVGVLPQPGQAKNDDDDCYDDDDDDYDLFDLFSRKRRRRRRSVSPPDDQEGGGGGPSEGNGVEDDVGLRNAKTGAAGRSYRRRRGRGNTPPLPSVDATEDVTAFHKALRKIFNLARSNVLARLRQKVPAGDGGVGRERLRDSLTAMASRALNVSSAEVTSAFGGMASRWVGEALLGLLLEDDEDGEAPEGDTDAIVTDQDNGTNTDENVKGSFNRPEKGIPSEAPRRRKGRPRTANAGQRDKQPEGQQEQQQQQGPNLSPSAIAYFLVELLGSVAGLSWGAWTAINHSG